MELASPAFNHTQGAEFPAVVIPLTTQQYLLLQRNLVYTGITRGKKLVVVVGQRKALAIAVQEQQDGAAVFRTAGKADRMTGMRQLRQRFIPDQVTARRSTCSCSPLSLFGNVSGRTN